MALKIFYYIMTYLLEICLVLIWICEEIHEEIHTEQLVSKPESEYGTSRMRSKSAS
jgi:hypothetical protein